MRIEADRGRCEGHGLCADAAPEMYDLDDEATVVVIHDEVPPDLERKAEAGCPGMSSGRPQNAEVSPLCEVVVAGRLFDALTAVQTLRAERIDGRTTMLSGKDRRPFTCVLLSKDVRSGKTPPAGIALDVPTDLELPLETPTLGLDLNRRRVRIAAAGVPYDGLVIGISLRARPLPDADPASWLVQHSDHDGVQPRQEPASVTSVLVGAVGFLRMRVASRRLRAGRHRPGRRTPTRPPRGRQRRDPAPSLGRGAPRAGGPRPGTPAFQTHSSSAARGICPSSSFPAWRHEE